MDLQRATSLLKSLIHASQIRCTSLSTRSSEDPVVFPFRDGYLYVQSGPLTAPEHISRTPNLLHSAKIFISFLQS